MRKMRSWILVGLSLLLAGCWNGENVHVQLGDVSIGQQLIDLQRAVEEGAITEKEFQQIKQMLLAPTECCDEEDEDDETRWF